MYRNNFYVKYKNRNNKKPPSYVKITLKICGIVTVLYLLACMCLGTVAIIFDMGSETFTDAEAVNVCNSYYYKKDYGELRDTLQLFNWYDEKFDIYWEIVDGYTDFVLYEQWVKAKEKNIDGSREKIEYYRQKVIDNAKNCMYKDNEKQLQIYANNVK